MLAYAAKVGQHLLLVGIAQVHMDGDSVSSVTDGFFHSGNQGLVVAVGGEFCGGGKMNDKANVRSGPAVAAADEPLVHQDSVCTALGHVIDSFLHVGEALDGTHGDAVVHGNDDGAAVIAVDDAFKTDLFAEVHWNAPFVDWVVRGSGGKEKGRRLDKKPAAY